MCNIGVDAAVAEVAGEMKKKPLLSGAMAYGAAAVKVLAGQIGFPARVQIDDEEPYDQDFLFIAIGNGGYCGGGFHSTPLSKLDDGLMDACLVKNITRRKIAAVILKYRAGTHLTDKACEGLVTYRKCRKLRITPLRPYDEHVERMALDGEGSGFLDTTFEVVPSSIKFIVPQGCELL
jgi:diacylglycerol kinase family enzyme